MSAHAKNGHAEVHTKSAENRKIGSKTQSDLVRKDALGERDDAHVDKSVLLAEPGGSSIKEAVHKCEPEVTSVCRNSACPTKNLIKRTKDDCEGLCETAVFETAFHTGELECDEGESMEACKYRKFKALKSQFRDPILEALVREHLLKCVCVTRDPDNRVCYEGTLGLKQGQKWCEWHDAPSWRKLLDEGAKAGLHEHDFPKPECSSAVRASGFMFYVGVGFALCLFFILQP
eukprot:gnl/TRDRNA2_/TRDRNA2_129749_c0_seq2.p1 gnl/TRDRNA2_/TRDRNA2_129749_c0~~gnl/TRDRNA2_/TRDRNA2_129749_c0_seq2.p1  ORF type:complete len:232 (+),score=33.46 gnl/TRDRNA2_/TRDRNA2_129749_c0_seq2:262-957(+)